MHMTDGVQKGFEVVLLLGAAVIRDVYFGHMNETFNIAASATSGLPSPVNLGLHNSAPMPNRLGSPTTGAPIRDPRVPPTDPRSQWELDAETARLKRLAAEEERERKRMVDAEEKQIKRMLEAEDKERRRKQAEIDKETERLQRLYGQEQNQVRPGLPARHEQRYSEGQVPSPYDQPHTQQSYHPTSWGALSSPNNSPYLGVPGSQPSQSTFFDAQSEGGRRPKPKKSFFGFKREVEDTRLQKKRSSQF